jgi:MATE family multidrug resistance protein
MLGFVTAMETFCGQAYGAQRYNMVGVVLQRGLAISFLYCCTATGMWFWCERVLLYMGQVRKQYDWSNISQTSVKH